MEPDVVFNSSHITESYHIPQQAQEPHGNYSAVDVSLHASLLDDALLNEFDPNPNFFGQLWTFPVHEPYNSDLTSEVQTTPASPMGPPARARKRKAPTLRAGDWEPVKLRILELHITQGMPLPKVKNSIEEEFGFVAELRQYRTRISQWGKDKNVKSHEMNAIVRKRQHRNLVEVNKGELAFEVRGVPVEPQKIERWMKRNDVPESLPYAPSPAASTPSAVACRTISECGSSATDLGYSLMAAPGISYDMELRSGFPSPALSISSIVRPQSTSFAGVSPAPIYRSLPRNFLTSVSGSSDSMDFAAHPTQYRYKQDEEGYLRRKLSMEESIHGTGHLNTLGTLHTLAGVLFDQGRYRSAEELVRREIEARKLIHGNESPHTLVALHALGAILGIQGHYSQSEKVLRRIFNLSRNILGAAHPVTVQNMNNLGGILMLQSRFVEAEETQEEAIALSMEILGEEHLDTVHSLNGLARVYQKQGRHAEAIQIFKKTLSMSEKQLGSEDQYTLGTMLDLAWTYSNQGDNKMAEKILLEKVIVIERVLGSEHPDTLGGLSNLAVVHQRQGRLLAAEELCSQVLESRKKVLGKRHPHTVGSLSNLASIYENQGRWVEANELHLQVQRMKEGLE